VFVGRKRTYEKYLTPPAPLLSRSEPSIHGTRGAAVVPGRTSPFCVDWSDQRLADRLGDRSTFEIDPITNHLAARLCLFTRNFFTNGRSVYVFGVAFVRGFEDGFARLLTDPLVALKGAAPRDKNYGQHCNREGNHFH